MRKIIFSLLALCCISTAALSQKGDYVKRPALGIHFFGNDFLTPKKINETSFTDVMKDDQWSKFSEMNFGFAANYMKGLTNLLDFSTTLGVSFLDYPMENKPLSGDDAALLEWDAMMIAKLFSDKYWVSPY